MAYEVSNMLLEVTMLEDRIAHLFMFVCVFLFCFPFTLSSLCHVYCAGFCTSLKCMLQDDGCMGVGSKDVQDSRRLGSPATSNRSFSL